MPNEGTVTGVINRENVCRLINEKWPINIENYCNTAIRYLLIFRWCYGIIGFKFYTFHKLVTESNCVRNISNYSHNLVVNNVYFIITLQNITCQYYIIPYPANVENMVSS
jgi:hypothetical protein